MCLLNRRLACQQIDIGDILLQICKDGLLESMILREDLCISGFAGFGERQAYNGLLYRRFMLGYIPLFTSQKCCVHLSVRDYCTSSCQIPRGTGISPLQISKMYRLYSPEVTLVEPDYQVC